MKSNHKFKEIFSTSYLQNLYREKIEFKASPGIDKINKEVFSKRFDKEIDIIIKKTYAQTYNFSYYLERLISKGRDKCPRVLSIPTIRDKITLKAIAEFLSKTHDEAVSRELVHTKISNIKKDIFSCQYDTFIKIDIQSFFPNINHDKLLKIIKRKIHIKPFLDLLSKAIKQTTVIKSSSKTKKYSEKKGVPQGLSISNILADIFMQDIDKKYKSNTTIKYYRYVDDILILCNQGQEEALYEMIKKDFIKKDLSVHELNKDSNKTDFGLISEGFNFLGYLYENDKLTVRASSIEKLENSIIKIFAQYKYSKEKNIKWLEWVLNLKITGCRIDEKKYGWLFFFSQIDDIKLLFRLDKFVESMCIKFGIDQECKVKKFVRTYHEILNNRTDTKYIPNFDLFDFEDKRILLRDVFSLSINGWDEVKIEIAFKRKIYKSIKELEKDIQWY